MDMRALGPKTITFAAGRSTICGDCKHHVCVASFHVRSGLGSWREYACMHPEAWEPVASDTPAVAEARGRLRQMEADNNHGGRLIGRTDAAPAWCPFLRTSV